MDVWAFTASSVSATVCAMNVTRISLRAVLACGLVFGVLIGQAACSDKRQNARGQKDAGSRDAGLTAEQLSALRDCRHLHEMKMRCGPPHPPGEDIERRIRECAHTALMAPASSQREVVAAFGRARTCDDFRDVSDRRHDGQDLKDWTPPSPRRVRDPAAGIPGDGSADGLPGNGAEPQP